MDCLTAQENLGAYVDGELAGTRRAMLVEHVAGCEPCLVELSRVHALIRRLRALSELHEVKAPPDLWPKIAQRLTAPSAKPVAGTRTIAFFRKPAAAAAAVALLIGGGLLLSLWPMTGPQTARADSIDYDVLLDNLSSGPESAFLRFLDRYRAESIGANAARSAAPKLGFSLPPRLPSGHRLDRVYKLRFGSSSGIAARYTTLDTRRPASWDGLPGHSGASPRGESRVNGHQSLFVFFHPPTDREHAGKYQEQPCLIGAYHGRQVEIGSWRLIHVTDSSTCRCVLTTLDMESQVPPVLAAILPSSGAH